MRQHLVLVGLNISAFGKPARLAQFGVVLVDVVQIPVVHHLMRVDLLDCAGEVRWPVLLPNVMRRVGKRHIHRGQLGGRAQRIAQYLVAVGVVVCAFHQTSPGAHLAYGVPGHADLQVAQGGFGNGVFNVQPVGHPQRFGDVGRLHAVVEPLAHLGILLHCSKRFFRLMHAGEVREGYVHARFGLGVQFDEPVADHLIERLLVLRLHA